jgi:hypothetical protein
VEAGKRESAIEARSIWRVYLAAIYVGILFDVFPYVAQHRRWSMISGLAVEPTARQNVCRSATSCTMQTCRASGTCRLGRWYTRRTCRSAPAPPRRLSSNAALRSSQTLPPIGSRPRRNHTGRRGRATTADICFAARLPSRVQFDFAQDEQRSANSVVLAVSRSEGRDA